MPQTKKAKVTSKKKVVAVVDVPVFDEKNAEAGLSDIQSFDFREYGYDTWQAAVVGLVNTQLGTNIKNKAREAANPKLTKEKLRQMALKRASSRPTDLQAAVAGDPVNGLERYLSDIEAEIQKEWDEEQAAKAAVLPDSEDDDTDDNGDDEE